MENVLNIINAISVLAVVAVGLYILFGLMQIINMAHGDMVMLGAYSVWIYTGIGLNFWLSVVLASLTVGAIGAVIEKGIIQLLYKTGNLSTMLATWGLSIILQQIIQLTFGPSGQNVKPPVSSLVNIFGVDYPLYPLLITLVCISILSLVYVILKKTNVGLLVRSTMDNRIMAEAMGVNTKQVYFFGFIGGSMLAGLAGALIAPITSITPLMGLDWVTKSFLVVITGGMDSMLSIVGGSSIIAGLDKLLNIYIGATTSWMIVLGIVIVTIWILPKGVFSKR